MNLAGAMNTGPTVDTVVILLLIGFLFFVCSWEHYHTGVLYLGYINGSDEGLFVCMCTALVCFLWGPAAFTRTLFRFADVDVTGRRIALAICVIAVVCTVSSCLYEVWRTSVRPHKQSMAAALLSMLPFAGVLACVALWLTAPESRILRQHYGLFLLTYALGFGHQTTKMILNRLVGERFPMFVAQYVPIVLGALLLRIGPLYIVPFPRDLEFYFLLAAFVFNLVTYLNWALWTIFQLTEFYSINCLTLTAKQLQAIQKKAS